MWRMQKKEENMRKCEQALKNRDTLSLPRKKSQKLLPKHLQLLKAIRNHDFNECVILVETYMVSVTFEDNAPFKEAVLANNLRFLRFLVMQKKLDIHLNDDFGLRWAVGKRFRER
eukprot:UN07940